MSERANALPLVAPTGATGIIQVHGVLQTLSKAEQLRHGLGISVLRLAATTGFFGLFLVLNNVLGLANWAVDLRVFALYWALSAGLVLLCLRSPTYAHLTGIAIPLMDMPLVFFIQLSTFPESNPSGVAGFTVGIYVLLVFLTALSMRWWIVVGTAAIAAFWEGWLQHVAHVDSGAVVASALLLFLTAGACIYGQRRLLGLLGGAVKHARERQEIEVRMAKTDRLAALGLLTANVAHDVNNPMTYVLSNLEYLRRWAAAAIPEHPMGDEELKELRQAIRDTHEGAQRVKLLVRDLTMLSRSGSTGQRDLRSMDVQRVVESAVNVCRTEVTKHARLETHYGDAVFVMGDEARLGQVLVNLLMNAAQAIPPGHPDKNVVDVTLSARAEQQCLIEVRDSGSGIPEAVRGRIFEAFFTTKPSESGTGLGLSICRQIVKEHAGTIEVDSEVGKGTVFRILLPLAT